MCVTIIILHDKKKKRKLEDNKRGEKEDKGIDLRQTGELNEKKKLEMEKVKVERTHTLDSLNFGFSQLQFF